MDKVSVKLKIADREYPMTVDAPEEDRILEAGRMVNEHIAQYKSKFKLDDKQDLLAIVAFDCFYEKLVAEAAKVELQSAVSNKLDVLTKLVSTKQD